MKYMNISLQTAILALGNFWEPEYAFGKLHGVVTTEVGYTGGTSSNPTYHDLHDHCEAVQIEFDPHIISYDHLLQKFWKLHDPTKESDTAFRSTIFYLDETQRQLAEQSKEVTQTILDTAVLTEILPATKFYPAEAYHQHYIAKLRREIKTH